MQIAFMQTGTDTSAPTTMIRSFRKFNVSAKIIQVTDQFSPVVVGADDVKRFDGNVSQLMLFINEVFCKG